MFAHQHMKNKVTRFVQPNNMQYVRRIGTPNATTQRPGKVTHFVRRNDYDRDFRGATHLLVGSWSDLLGFDEEY